MPNSIIQKLTSGETRTCHLEECVDLASFSTHTPSHPVASNGGTIFIIEYATRWFAITAKHVAGKENGYNFSDLQVYTRINGELGSPLKIIRAFGPSPLTEHGENELGEILDLAIIEIERDDTRQIERYFWEDATVAVPSAIMNVRVFGFLKDQSNIKTTEETIKYQKQPFTGEFTHEPTGTHSRELLTAIRQLSDEELSRCPDNLTGLSGAPVFCMRQNKIYGMVVRGGICRETKSMSVHFIRATHISKLLELEVSDNKETHYEDIDFKLGLKPN